MAMDWGIKVSESGQNVLTAIERLLSLKSDFTLLKVVLSGTVNLSAAWTEVTHNLGYVPQFLVFTKDTGWTPNRTFLATGAMPYAVARADTTKLYIRQEGTNSIAYYYIFYEQA